MTLPRRLVGLVLAGGQSRRWNQIDKGLIEWNGKALTSHSLSHLTPHCESLWISCNRHTTEYSKLADHALHDTEPDQGPLAGILSAYLEMRRRKWQRDLLVLPCDSPCLPENYTRKMLGLDTFAETSDGYPEGAPRVAEYQGQHHFLHLWLPWPALNSLPGYLESGQRKVETWLQTQDFRTVHFDDGDPRWFCNLNRARDLDRLLNDSARS